MKHLLILSSITIAGLIIVFTMVNNTIDENKTPTKEIITKQKEPKQYQEIFKEIKPRDEIQELSKQQKYEQLSKNSKELITKADKLIKEKNLKTNKKEQIDKEKLNRKIAQLQNKIEELR